MKGADTHIKVVALLYQVLNRTPILNKLILQSINWQAWLEGSGYVCLRLRKSKKNSSHLKPVIKTHSNSVRRSSGDHRPEWGFFKVVFKINITFYKQTLKILTRHCVLCRLTSVRKYTVCICPIIRVLGLYI